MTFAIKVIWNNGEEELLKQGLSSTVASFNSQQDAKEWADFMKMGMDAAEIQSINIIPYPMLKAAAPSAPQDWVGARCWKYPEEVPLAVPDSVNFPTQNLIIAANPEDQKLPWAVILEDRREMYDIAELSFEGRAIGKTDWNADNYWYPRMWIEICGVLSIEGRKATITPAPSMAGTPAGCPKCQCEAFQTSAGKARCSNFMCKYEGATTEFFPAQLDDKKIESAAREIADLYAGERSPENIQAILERNLYSAAQSGRTKDLEKAAELLEFMYDKWENGDPAFSDSDDSLGNALHLGDKEDEIIDVLNKLFPRTPPVAAQPGK